MTDRNLLLIDYCNAFKQPCFIPSEHFAPQGNYDEVEELVLQGANVNTQSTIKWETPLHKAAQ